MSTLIVSLPLQPSGSAPEYDYVLSPDGQTVGTHASASAALLPRPGGAGAEVVALVPLRALSWHQIELPRGTTPASPRLRSVLEGMLEDRLLDEPESLHFALQPQARPGEPVWVASCDRAWLRNAVQALEVAQRPVSRIVPELAPGEPATLHALGDPERAELVIADGNGVALWPLAASGLPALPETEQVLAEPGVAALAEQVLQRQVTLEQTAQRHLRAARSAWDLAQFELASSGRRRALKRLSSGWGEWLRAPQWRAARWGAALLLLAQLAGLNAWAWKERSALAAKREAVRTTLTSTFPHVRVVVDAPIQMEREVALLRQSTGASSGRDLEATLVAFSAAAPAGSTPTAIEFAANQVRLKGLNLTAEGLRNVESALAARGYAARGEGDALVLSQGAAR
ncbi:MAG: general secretion pathway protein GspL [Ramlibacter sp.]|nr:general secretion pathway protein GspL [Ramlibacter sp.]